MLPVANILQPLIDFAEIILELFHDEVGFGWGASIIALTFVIRALLIPLTYRQLKGMRALQALQPQIKEIQAKYKNDRQRMQQEMVRFYQANKVNPLASCIPLLAQLPVFIALFYLLQDDLRKDICGQTDEPCGELAASDWSIGVPGDESFLFVADLTAKATGSELIVLLLLYVGTQMAASLVMMVTSESSQRLLMFVLPLIFVPIIINFPAGLVVYWIATNVWTIGQQYAVQKLIPPPSTATPEAATAAVAAKPPPPPPRKKKKRR